jgi:hypothetical protein
MIGANPCLYCKCKNGGRTFFMERSMAYIYSGVSRLQGKPLVGNGNCALMVEYYGKLPSHSHWHEGLRVVEQKEIGPGTAIATFEDGRYPNKPHNNHVAFFVRFGTRSLDGSWNSIWIMEQFKASGRIQLRELRSKGKTGNHWIDPSNNADAFSIIE